MISSSLGRSHKFAGLRSHFHKLVYVLTLTHADAEGRIEADARLIYADSFVLDPEASPEAIEAALLDLARVELIRLYEAHGKRYAEFVDFHKHNTISRYKDGPDAGKPSREAESKIPPPPRDKGSDDGGGAEPLRSNSAASEEQVSLKVKSKSKVKGNTPSARARETDESSEPKPSGEELVQELTNENSIKRLERTAPTVHALFEEMARLQRTSFALRLTQATALLERVRFAGASAVEASLRTVLDTAGDGGPLFRRSLAHLDRQQKARASPTEAEHDEPMGDLLDDDAPLSGKWGKN